MANQVIDLTIKPCYPNQAFEQAQGLGMTSQRTRDRLIGRLIEEGIADAEVLNVMRVVPRHLFMDEAMANRAYEDTALPIGYGQTISQPLVVALMTAWVRNGKPLTNVLDIGTGSGYQAAILALLADHVYTVERIEPLQQRAKQVMDRLGLNNVDYHLSDGHWGWPQKAPFDAIICAAAPSELPHTLIEQLAVGGRLVLPIGARVQTLIGVEKTADGIRQFNLGGVMFVPLLTGVEP